MLVLPSWLHELLAVALVSDKWLRSTSASSWPTSDAEMLVFGLVTRPFFQEIPFWLILKMRWIYIAVNHTWVRVEGQIAFEVIFYKTKGDFQRIVWKNNRFAWNLLSWLFKKERYTRVTMNIFLKSWSEIWRASLKNDPFWMNQTILYFSWNLLPYHRHRKISDDLKSLPLLQEWVVEQRIIKSTETSKNVTSFASFAPTSPRATQTVALTTPHHVPQWPWPQPTKKSRSPTEKLHLW